MLIAIHALIPVFFVMSLGYLAGKRGWIAYPNIGGFNSLLMNYALPAALFVGTAGTSARQILGQGPLLAMLGGSILCIYGLWYWLPFWKAAPDPRERSVQALSAAFPNFAAMGLSLVGSLHGSDRIWSVALAIAIGALLPSPLTLILLESSRPGRMGHGSPGWPELLGQVLFKPIVLAPLAGIVCALADWPPPPLLLAALEPLVKTAGGLALFLTGLILSQTAWRLRTDALIGAALINIVQPLLAWGIGLSLHATPTSLRLGVLLSALPAGFFGMLFGQKYDVDTTVSQTMLIYSTLFSIVSLYLTISWLTPSS